jgi:hypothetical protein
MPNRPEFSGPPAPQRQTKACLLLSRSPSPMRHARPVIRRTLELDFSASTQSIRDRQPSRLSRWAAFSGFCGTLPVAGTGTNVTQIGMAPAVTGQWNFHGRAVTEQVTEVRTSAGVMAPRIRLLFFQKTPMLGLHWQPVVRCPDRSEWARPATQSLRTGCRSKPTRRTTTQGGGRFGARASQRVSKKSV